MPLATAIRPHLFLGDANAAQNREGLKFSGITHVINLTVEVDDAFPAELIYLRVRAKDNAGQHLLPYFGAINAFIEAALRQPQAKVMLHCSEGISRSATAALAWLMYSERLQLDEAFAELKSLRPVIEPNPSFLRQLRHFEATLGLARRTTQNLTFLDDAAADEAETPLSLNLLRLLSKAATDGVNLLTGEDYAACVAAFAEVNAADAISSYQQMVVTTFDAFGSRSPRDAAARAALGQLSRALRVASPLSTPALEAALSGLPRADAWTELDLPLGSQFLAELLQAVEAD